MIRSIDSVAVVAVSVVSLVLASCSPGGDGRSEQPWLEEGPTNDVRDVTSPDVEEPAVPDVRPGDAMDAGDGISDLAPDVREPDVAPDAACEDSDDDGLSDCEERERCTDPEKSDTDSDGLEDGEEMELGSDPCDEDTDGDGLEDGEERRYRLDPTDSSSYDDGGDDSERWFLDVCDERHSSEPIDTHEHRAGNWTVAIGALHSYTALQVDDLQAPEGVAVFQHEQAKIAGGVFSIRASESHDAPTDFLAGLEPGGLDEVSSVEDTSISDAFRAGDGKSAALAEFDVSTAGGVSVWQLRRDVLFAATALSEPDVTPDIPAPGSEKFERFRVRVTAKYRRHASGARTHLVEFAVAPREMLQQGEVYRRRFEDSAAPDSLADLRGHIDRQCDVFRVDKSGIVLGRFRESPFYEPPVPASVRLFYKDREWIPWSPENGWMFERVSEELVFSGDMRPQIRVREAGHPIWIQAVYQSFDIPIGSCHEHSEEDVNTCESY
jgi:hypothetical protein